MYPGNTPTKLGRVQSCPPLRMDRLHVHRGTPLREVEHPLATPVLDQEDLEAQSIDVTRLVAGAQPVDALGSCTCNAGTAHVAERMTAAGKDLAHASATAADGQTVTLSATDPKADEEFAILLYHQVTSQTGNPAGMWPPQDCGSSGYYVCSELERLKLASSYKSGSGIMGALSLLQSGTVMQGSPWFQAWFSPDSQGFVDGDGSYDAFQAAMDSGVAGGHETLQYAIPQLGALHNGTVDLANTIIRVRNSWSASWNLAGDYLIHASTLNYLASYVDYKQAVI